LSVWIDKVLKFIILFKLLLDDEIVKLRENNRYVLLNVSKPRDLPLGRFDISIGNEYSLKSSLNLGKLDDAWKIMS